MDGSAAQIEIFLPEQKVINCPEGEAGLTSTSKRNASAITMINSNEVVLLQQKLSAGDEAAYVRLYRIYFTSLLHFATSFVKSKPLAEEIVSDVFLQIWQNQATVHTIENLTVYLYASVRNRSLSCKQKEKRGATLSLENEHDICFEDHHDPEELYITSELAKLITEVICQLPPRCQMIFRLIREDNLKYREVAVILDISQKTVEAQMGIAMKKIHEAIRPFTGNTSMRTNSHLFKAN